MKPKRLRKKDTPPEVWIAHKKARKKIASAKWYARVHKERVHERDLQRKQRETQQQQEREELIQRSLDTQADRDLFEVRWLHTVHGWPVCPPDIPVADWLALLQLAQRSCAYVRNLPAFQCMDPEVFSGRIRHFQSLCVTELEQYFRRIRSPRPVYQYDDPRDDAAWGIMEARIQGGTSKPAEDTQSHQGESSSGTMSWLVSQCVQWRQQLVGSTFPWTATWLGLVLADLLWRGRSQSWPGLLRYMVQLNHTNPTALPNHIGQQTMIHNPSHIPTQTPP